MNKDYCVELIQNLYKIVNENPLPISVKYYIIKDLYNEVTSLYEQYITSLGEENKNEKEEEE